MEDTKRIRTLALVSVVLLAALCLIGATTRASSSPDRSPAAGLAPDAPQPLVITYQGRLGDPLTGEPKPDGGYTALFGLYAEDSGGTALWEQQKDIVVSKGLFSVQLGGDSLNPIDPAFFDGYGRWLSVKVRVPPDPFEELLPRIRVAHAPYAIWSNLAQNAYNADRLGNSLPSAFVSVAGDTMNGTLTVSVPAGGSDGVTSTTASTTSGDAGVEGKNTGAGYGMLAGSVNNHGIFANTTSTAADIAGVYALGGGKTGLTLNQEAGVKGEAADGIGVAGLSTSSMGVFGYSINSRGVEAEGYDYGLYAYARAPSPALSYGLYARTDSTSGYAGYFLGRVYVNGSFTASGTKSFGIDHPLDPANKYLYHFAVESPEVRNLYEGTVAMDANGEAVVMLSDYFDALNADAGFNYQLTCIGGYAPVYIAEEVSGNQFKIAGGKAGLKVSWQVTAIRDDPYLRDHPVQAEVDKNADEKGKYQYPEGYGQPKSMAIADEPSQLLEPGPAKNPNQDSAASGESQPADRSEKP